MNRQPEEFWIDEGCWITELAISEADEGLSIARARVEPGATTRWHQLKHTVERYLIESGVGLVEIGDNPPRPVTADDRVYIPANTRQRIRNTGERDLIFLALCTPRFRPENYQDLE